MFCFVLFFLQETVRLLCTEPARLSGLDHRKSRLDVGYDGDMCVWDPEGTVTVTEDMLEFQHKATPYLNRTLQGVVHATILRGSLIYQRTDVPAFGPPLGSILLDGPKAVVQREELSKSSTLAAGSISVEELEDDDIDL